MVICQDVGAFKRHYPTNDMNTSGTNHRATRYQQRGGNGNLSLSILGDFWTIVPIIFVDVGCRLIW